MTRLVIESVRDGGEVATRLMLDGSSVWRWSGHRSITYDESRGCDVLLASLLTSLGTRDVIVRGVSEEPMLASVNVPMYKVQIDGKDLHDVIVTSQVIAMRSDAFRPLSSFLEESIENIEAIMSESSRMVDVGSRVDSSGYSGAGEDAFDVRAKKKHR